MTPLPLTSCATLHCTLTTIAMTHRPLSNCYDGALTFAGARPPKELKKTLEEERAVLHRNWKMNELEKNSGNLTAMSQTVDDLLKYASGTERAELQQLKTKIDRKRLGKKVKWGIYASIAAV